MKPTMPWLLAVACSVAFAGAALAAEPASPSGDAQAGRPATSTAPRTGAATTPQHKPSDPLGNLKPYEERRYRIDMQDCGKEKGVDRRLCERSVERKAAAKSRRRATTGR